MVQEQLKPYSVSQGEQATDWWVELTILEQLKEKGEENWTTEERNKVIQLSILAGQWVTCACGNQCEIIPRNGGAPVDGELHHLGLRFSSDVDDLNIEEAALTLEKIEKRSETLIKRILKKNAKSA